MMETKRCSYCKETKPVSEFHENRKKGTLQSQCKECQKELYRQHYARNIEKARERLRLRYLENKEQEAERQKIYRSLNQDKRRAWAAKRRANKLQASPCWLTKEDYKVIEIEYRLATWCSDVMGEKYHVDHIVPLQGKKVCGLHVPWNLRVIPATENIRKGNKYDQSVWEPERSS